MTTSAVKWAFDADYLQGCNCDYGCPCEFSAPPTAGFCDGIGAWKISRGKFGDVPLDGLAFDFKMAGKNSSVRIGNAAVLSCESIKNPVTGEPEEVQVNHGTGFIFKEA